MKSLNLFIWNFLILSDGIVLLRVSYVLVGIGKDKLRLVRLGQVRLGQVRLGQKRLGFKSLCGGKSLLRFFCWTKTTAKHTQTISAEFLAKFSPIKNSAQTKLSQIWKTMDSQNCKMNIFQMINFNIRWKHPK